MGHAAGQGVAGINFEPVADRIVFVQPCEGAEPDVPEVVFHEIPDLVARYVVGIGGIVAVAGEIAVRLYLESSYRS